MTTTIESPVVGSAAAEEVPRRALVLAGGGLRLSWQTGVLRALLEAGLRFHLLDATSAGGLNAAMWLSGQTPEEMSRRWRAQSPVQAFRPRAPWHYLRPSGLTAMGDPGAFRDRVITELGIDLHRVRQARDVVAWFNVLDYTRMAVECVPHTELDEDMLVAGLSLPGILPPVERDGRVYLDAGFARDANPLEAVRRGADEVWIAWAMIPSPRFRGGPLQIYIQSLEMSANTALHEDLARIAEINQAIGRGERPLGRTSPVAVHIVRPPQRLPLDVDLYFGGTSHGSLIDQGYRDAARYLESSRSAGAETEPEADRPSTTLRLTLRGPFALGAQTPDDGARRGREAASTLVLHAAIAAGATDAEVVGHIDASALCEGVPLRAGQLSAAAGRIEYELAFSVDGRDYHLGLRSRRSGRDLAATLFEGGADGEIVGAGVLEVAPASVAKALLTVRATGTGGTVEAFRTLRASSPLLVRHLLGR